MNGAVDFRSMVARNLARTHERVQLCTADITDEEARRALAGQLTPIIWQIGHLVTSEASVGQRAGVAVEVPRAYEDLFKRGSGGQAAYPPLAELKEAFDATQQAMLKAATSADYSTPIDAPNYSTVGEMMVNVGAHRGYHIGKMTTLRALLGKKRLFG